MNTSLLAGETRSSASVCGLAAHLGFDGLQDGLRVQIQFAEHLGVEVPLGLRKGDKQVLVAQDTVLAPPCVLDGAVDDALGGLADLAGSDVEIFHVTLRLHAGSIASFGPAVVDPAQGAGRSVEVVGDAESC